jgi:hypothetical protein
VAGVLKSDFPPLLAPGLHPMTMQQLQDLCVRPFTLSTSRPLIIEGVRYVARQLEEIGVIADLWIDGSFLTEKITPDDADIVLRIDSNQMPSPTPEQLERIRWVRDEDLKTPFYCDTYVFVEFPIGHPLYRVGQGARDYWSKWFGTNRRDELTGMAVLELRNRP